LATDIHGEGEPPTMLEFLAKRLLWGPSGSDRDKMVLLGSPIYVAMSE